MPTKVYLKHPIKLTKFGRQALRARLSLNETQDEFSDRFHVSALTIHKWETGKVLSPHPIYTAILDALTARLAKEGLLIDDDIMSTIDREDTASRGDADF